MGETAGEYLRVGNYLCDALIVEIDALDWAEDKDRVAKIRQALQRAAPHRKGFLFDVHGWTLKDYAFLHNTPIGRQIRALKEQL